MSNDVYVRLKALRKAHGLKQSDLGGILGLEQTSVSRLESRHALMNEQQYKALVERFGEEEVAKYVGEPPWKNLVTNSEPDKRQAVQQFVEVNDTKIAEMAVLARIIAQQRARIESLEKEIEELKKNNVL